MIFPCVFTEINRKTSDEILLTKEGTGISLEERRWFKFSQDHNEDWVFILAYLLTNEYSLE